MMIPQKWWKTSTLGKAPTENAVKTPNLASLERFQRASRAMYRLPMFSITFFNLLCAKFVRISNFALFSQPLKDLSEYCENAVAAWEHEHNPRNNRKGGTASLRSGTCVKRNVAFGARFKGLSLYFLYQMGI